MYISNYIYTYVYTPKSDSLKLGFWVWGIIIIIIIYNWFPR